MELHCSRWIFAMRLFMQNMIRQRTQSDLKSECLPRFSLRGRLLVDFPTCNCDDSSGEGSAVTNGLGAELFSPADRPRRKVDIDG
jgi:hypothetical protein